MVIGGMDHGATARTDGGEVTSTQVAPDWAARHRQSVPVILGTVAWLAVLGVAVWRAHLTLSDGSAGLDLEPLRGAGRALRAGQPIYSITEFVYPPPAALLGWMISWASFHSVVVLYTYFEVAAIGLTLLLLRGCFRPVRWQLLESAVLAGLLLRGDLVGSLLWLDNVSVLILLPCAFVLIRWGDGRWRPGGVVLGLTLLVKPVLLPLIVLPVVFRRWRTVAEALGVALVGLVLSLPLADGVGSLAEVARRLGGGSSLVGRQAVFNTSIVQVGLTHHVPIGLIVLARVAVVVVAGLGIARVVRAGTAPSRLLVGSLGALVLSAVFLAGPLAESHYLMLLIPGCLMVAMAEDRPARALLVGAVLVAAYPADAFHGLGDSVVSMQARCAMIEFMVFAAASKVLLSRPVATEPSDDLTAESTEVPTDVSVA